MINPTGVEVAPHLSERDARAIGARVVERLRALHANPSQIGVHLERDGFWFAATINGRLATAHVGEGNWTYEQVARDLLLASLDPEWNRLFVQPPERHD